MLENRIGVNLANRQARVMDNEGRSKVVMDRYIPIKMLGGGVRRMEVLAGLPWNFWGLFLGDRVL